MSKAEQFEVLQLKVLKWGESKSFVEPKDIEWRKLKLFEELGEVVGAYLKNDHEALKMELGDVLVVLCLLGAMYNKFHERPDTTRNWGSYMIQYNGNVSDRRLRELVQTVDSYAVDPHYAFELIGALGFCPIECLRLAHEKNVKRDLKK